MCASRILQSCQSVAGSDLDVRLVRAGASIWRASIARKELYRWSNENALLQEPLHYISVSLHILEI